MRTGAEYINGGKCRFNVWGPNLGSLSVYMPDGNGKVAPLLKGPRGWWKGEVDGMPAGSRYFYRIDEKVDRPDPYSNYQPDGVFGASEIVDHEAFSWKDGGWKNLPLKDYIIYELHTGTFSESGTFEGVISKLGYLTDLGVTAVEIMPVAQFPGDRNWGYDGVLPFAVQNTYGGPEGLKRLVDACHANGMAVILDVVYNHLGPEGNFLWEFGPCFSGKYSTPWGSAMNFDGEHSDGLREVFISNALYWMKDFHIDALRIDAVHGIYDMGAVHFLAELRARVSALNAEKGRPHYLVAESDLNDVKIILPEDKGGYGLDAQWCDDFHHSVHTLLTGDRYGYYEDFGNIRDMEKTFREGFVYTWDYSSFRKRMHGNSAKGMSPDKFVVCSQNHDQVGNRMNGERLTSLTNYEGLKLAASGVILSRYLPLLFMGEEYGEDSPFLYFMSFSDEGLIKAVREGRKKEFASFKWQGEPKDPYDPATFGLSKLKWEKKDKERHKQLLSFYKALIAIRKSDPVLSDPGAARSEVMCLESEKVIITVRTAGNKGALAVMNFQSGESEFSSEIPEGQWEKAVDSADKAWLGPGAVLPDKISARITGVMPGFSFVMYRKVCA